MTGRRTLLLLSGIVVLIREAEAAGITEPEPALIWPSVVAAALLLCCSGFFSGSETALFSLQPLDRQALMDGGNEQVEALVSRPRRALASLLIGNELANVTLSTVTAGLVLALVPDWPWVNVLVLTPVLLVAGEVIPKVIGLRWNRRVSALVAPPLEVFSRVNQPLRRLLIRIADFFVEMTGGTAGPTEHAIHEAQLRDLIDRGRMEGSIRPMEQEMLHNVFEFGDLTVHRLMTPRLDIFSLDLETPWGDLLARIRSAGFSRVPIWEGRPDRVIGVLVVKKLMPFLQRIQEGGPDPTSDELRSVLVPPRFIPTSKPASSLLREFRQQRLHLAMIVDEHGAFVGLVTLDDLLSELVGELLDVGEDADTEVVRVGEGEFAVRASMDADDFARRFEMALPSGNFSTIGGFVLSQLGEIPAPGTTLTWDGATIEVARLAGNRLEELLVKREAR